MAQSAGEKRVITYRDVFHNGNWMRLWAGQTFSQLGDFVSDIAFPLLVYEITKSPAGLALGFGIEMLPLIVIGPIAGVFVDRWNRRTLLLVADFVRIGCALGLFFSTSLWQLYILALIAAVMQAIFLAAYSATIPQITEDQFAKSISLSYMGYNTMQVIGPAVAAGIIGLTHGARPAFLFDAATFATGFLMTLTIQVSNVARKRTSRQFLSDLRSGASFLWRNTAVRYLASYHMVFTIVTAASTLGIILYIKTSLGLSATASDQLYGIAGAVLAGSLAFISWLVGFLDERLSKTALIFYAPVFTGLAYFLFLLHPEPAWTLVILVIVSVGSGCCLIPRQSLMAHAVPNNLRGRIYSCFNALAAATNLAAYGLFAALGLLLSAGMLLALTGAILLVGMPLCTLVLRGNQALREQPE
jgi:MFS transporter, DHA3 family, macrolide efflux protein